MYKLFSKRRSSKSSTIIVGSRASKLALKQVEEIIKKVGREDINFEIRTYDTTGDMDKLTPISEIEGTDFFTDTIEKALLNNEIDVAIHSAKDLPDKIPSGLVIAAITETIDPYDVLVSKDCKIKNLSDLPLNARIGTSSLRRKQQLKIFREDFEIIDIRGNIEERIKKLNDENLDAIVIAAAGLIRLGLENLISQRIPFEIIKPHPLQGSLAVECRSMDLEIINLFSKIDVRKLKKI